MTICMSLSYRITEKDMGIAKDLDVGTDTVTNKDKDKDIDMDLP